jgi:hypothetical protein
MTSAGKTIITVRMLPSPASPGLGDIRRHEDGTFTAHLDREGGREFAWVIGHGDGFEVRRYHGEPSSRRYRTWQDVADELYGHGAHIEHLDKAESLTDLLRTTG